MDKIFAANPAPIITHLVLVATTKDVSAADNTPL
jgi:hypothetical protein